MIERLANPLDAVAGPGNADVLGRESFDERGRGRRAFSTFGLWQPAGARGSTCTNRTFVLARPTGLERVDAMNIRIPIESQREADRQGNGLRPARPS
jgi:hypothetical protein